MLELRRHLRDHGPFWKLRGDPTSGELLFRGNRDAPFRRDSFYDSAWRPALVAAGLAPDAYVFHALRHWCLGIARGRDTGDSGRRVISATSPRR